MLDLQHYFIKEHVGLFKLHEAYDIIDPETQELIGVAIEQASGFRKLLKLVVNKTLLPFEVVLQTPNEQPILRIKRGFTFLRSKVSVLSADGQELGFFRQRLLSLGGRFDLHDANGEKFAELKGKWHGLNFRFFDLNDKELGQVTRKWSGVGKELFTSADNYVVALEDGTDRRTIGPLLLAAALCVDMVLKENK